MSQICLTQIQDLQNKLNSLSDAREFVDPDTASSSGASHVPSQPLMIQSPREVRSRDSGFPRFGKRFWKPLCLRKTILIYLRHSKNLASSSGRGGIREPQSSAIPTPRFNQGAAPLKPNGIKVFFKESVRIRHVTCGTLPCVTITSLNPDARMAEKVNSEILRVMTSPAKSRRKVVEKVQLPY